MAIKIPIVTVFDSKGLKQAQYQLNKVRGNFQNLGRNFAVAGAAIAGVATVIGKSVQNAAEAQRVFAQTEAVLKSTGTTANGTAREIANLASSLQKKTAVDDEAILAGQNLLLTFKSVQNQAGIGNDIFNQASQAMLDFARATNTDASSAAIKLGKALQDPTRGVTALRKSGVDFTKDQQEMIKSLVETGDLLGAQKIVLAELQTQFGGSAAAYAQTFAGQIDSLKNEMSDLSEEIGLVVMPAVQEFFSALRDIAPEAGQRLKEALAGIDWSALAKSLADLTIFFVQNAETILRVVTAMWALNTAYNAGKVAAGLYNAAAVILGNTFTITAGKIALTTGAVKLFRTALITTGIGAFVVALGFLIERLINYTDETKSAYQVTGSWGGAIRKTGQDAEWAASRYGIAAAAVRDYKNAIVDPAKETSARKSQMNQYLDFLTGRAGEAKKKETDSYFADLLKDIGGTGTGSGKAAKDAGKKTAESFNKGFDEGVKDKDGYLATLKYIKEVTDTLVLSDELQAGGSAVGNALAKHIAEGFKRESGYLARTIATDFAGNLVAGRNVKSWVEPIAKGAKRLVDAVAVLQERIIARGEFTKPIKQSFMDMFNFEDVENGIDGILGKFRKTAEDIKKFRTNLATLAGMGLNRELQMKLAQTQDFAAAGELVIGGPEAVKEINSLFNEIETASTSIADSLGQAFYNLGTDLKTGLTIPLEKGFGVIEDYFNADMWATRLNSIAIQASKLVPGSQFFDEKAYANLTQVQRDAALAAAKAADEASLLAIPDRSQIQALLQQLGLYTPPESYRTPYGSYGPQSLQQAVGMMSPTINIYGGVSTSAEIGQQVVSAIKAYERSSGKSWVNA